METLGTPEMVQKIQYDKILTNQINILKSILNTGIYIVLTIINLKLRCSSQLLDKIYQTDPLYIGQKCNFMYF